LHGAQISEKSNWAQLKNLGVDCIDVYYLHNPETQLAEVPKVEISGTHS